MGPTSPITPSSSSAPPFLFHDLDLGDINEDGNVDVGWVYEATFTVTMGPIFDMQAMGGNGDGSFSSGFGGQGNEAPAPPLLVVGDVLGAGAEGLVYAWDGGGAGFIFVLTIGQRTVGMSTNQVGGFDLAPGAPAGLAVGDWNGDQIDDVAVGDSAGVRVVTWISNGETGLDPEQGSALPVGTVPDALAAGNFTGGTDDDLFVSLGSAGYVVMAGDGTGAFTAGTATPLGSGRSFTDLAAGDLNGDGLEDVAGVVRQAGQPAVLGVLFSNGDGTFDPLIPTPLEPALGAAVLAHVHVGDVNGDGRADLVCVAPALDRTVVALSDGAGGFVLATDPDLTGGGHATLGLRDVDHDGDLDIVVTSAATLAVRALLNDSL